MQPVYHEFLRRSRETGTFLHPAQNRTCDQSPEDAQINAISEVIQVTINAASDCISVSKIEQVEEAKQRWEDDGKRLCIIARDISLAAELGMLGFDDPQSRSMAFHDAEVLRRVANWLDVLRSSTRRRDDPLIVDRNRGDPIVRGVQIIIGVKLEEQFADRLDGTGATLASVALGTETSPRVSRSALTDRKSSKRRSSS